MENCTSIEQSDFVKIQFKEIRHLLKEFSLKLVGRTNQSAADDLYQDTALRIIVKADKYRYQSSFIGWAKTIMRNIFIDNYRKETKVRMILESTPNQFENIPNGFSLKNSIEAKMEFDEIFFLVKSLPEVLSQPFLMKLEGYKYYEIAEELDAPLGTIKSRVFDARRKLTKLYNLNFKDKVS